MNKKKRESKVDLPRVSRIWQWSVNGNQIAGVLIESIVDPSVVHQLLDFRRQIRRQDNRSAHFTWSRGVLIPRCYQYSAAYIYENSKRSEIETYHVGHDFVKNLYQQDFSCDGFFLFTTRQIDWTARIKLMNKLRSLRKINFLKVMLGWIFCNTDERWKIFKCYIRLAFIGWRIFGIHHVIFQIKIKYRINDKQRRLFLSPINVYLY